MSHNRVYSALWQGVTVAFALSIEVMRRVRLRGDDIVVVFQLALSLAQCLSVRLPCWNVATEARFPQHQHSLTRAATRRRCGGRTNRGRCISLAKLCSLAYNHRFVISRARYSLLTNSPCFRRYTACDSLPLARLKSHLQVKSLCVLTTWSVRSSNTTPPLHFPWSHTVPSCYVAFEHTAPFPLKGFL